METLHTWRATKSDHGALWDVQREALQDLVFLSSRIVEADVIKANITVQMW
jgi:hypothetical protein